MPITLRPFTGQDYDAVASLNNLLYPDHRLTAEEWRRLDLRFDEARYTRRRYVAADAPTQHAGGYGIAAHLPALFHPQRYWFHLMVHPQWQRRGVGGLLLERLLDDLRALDVDTLWTEVREDRTQVLAFLQKRGFTESRRSWELRLSVAEADPAALMPLSQRAAGEGVIITTLAEERQRDVHCLAKLYELARAVSADVPWPVPALPMAFADFAQWLDYPETLSDGFFIAQWGAQYIGFSTTSRTEGEPQTLYVNLTGVRRESRRLGVALALKQHTVQYAQRHRYQHMIARNDSANAAMIALNLRLGFRYHAGWVTLTSAGPR